MARRSARTVQCYLCRRRFEVGARAQSTSCPGCNKPVIVEDIIVKQLKPVKRVQTCGRIVVQKKGRIISEFVEAHEGIEVLGVLQADVISGGPVIIGAKARWKGDLRAPSLEIKQGARIEGGRFSVPDDPVGVGDLRQP